MQKKIGLIEDDQDNLLLMKLLLEEKYEVQAFENGREAIQSFNSNPPDLILLDISLPEMDGFGVLKEIKKNEILSRIPVIAMTAYTYEKADLISIGFNEYIIKPILDENLLFNYIEQLLNKR